MDDSQLAGCKINPVHGAELVRAAEGSEPEQGLAVGADRRRPSRDAAIDAPCEAVEDRELQRLWVEFEDRATADPGATAFRSVVRRGRSIEHPIGTHRKRAGRPT